MGMTENTRIYCLVVTTYYFGDLGPLLQGQTKVATFKSAYNSLVIGLPVMNMKPTYKKSWAGGNEFASCGNDLVSGGNDLLSIGNDLVSSGNKLLSGEQFSKWWERVSKWWE